MAKDTLSIIGGRVIDPRNKLDSVQDLHIADGQIIALGAAPDGFVAQQQIQAQGQIVCPGLVDLSVRLREPGAEHKATIASETYAAACNGITTLCCPPDTNPVIDTPAVAELLQQRAKQSGAVRVLPLAALTQGLKGRHLAEMGDLFEAGCVGVSNAQHPIENTQVLRNALAYATSHHLPVHIQSRDPWLGNEGCAHEGGFSGRLGLPSIPSATESIALARDLMLVESTGAHAHFGRISCSRSVWMLHEAQNRGMAVTADVCAHQLFLIDEDIGEYNSQYHVYPPLRSAHDRDALRQGILDGVIGSICSDHQPHEPEAKHAPFSETAPGISALDTFLPLVLRLEKELELSLLELLKLVTWNPAQILGQDLGHLSIGAAADVCIFDPEQHWIVDEDSMHSLRYNSPFLGQSMQGRVTNTLLGGRPVYRG